MRRHITSRMNDQKRKRSGLLDPRLCEVPMWAKLKSELANLNFQDFFEQAASDQEGVLIDVRTSEEFQQNKIIDCKNISYLSENLADELEQLPKELTYYIFCRTGRRSLRVCVLLKNSGYKHVFNLENGIITRDIED